MSQAATQSALFLRPLRLRISSSLSRPLARLLSTSTPAPLITHTTFPAPHTGNISLLTLSSPPHNALSTPLLSTLSRLLTTLSTHPPASTRCLILSSSLPRTFSAGADLRERLSLTLPETRAYLALLRATLLALETLPFPSIAAVHGLALGGGLELALAATWRVFATSASVGLPETRLGIVPGAGGMGRLGRLVGSARAGEMVATGRRVSAKEAWRMGICERLVDGEEEGGEGDEGGKVLEAALQMAREVCEGAPLALGAARRFFADAVSEEEAYEEILGTEDRLEGLRAFKEKRRPVYKGR